jgi:hypothetical protein
MCGEPQITQAVTVIVASRPSWIFQRFHFDLSVLTLTERPDDRCCSHAREERWSGTGAGAGRCDSRIEFEILERVAMSASRPSREGFDLLVGADEPHIECAPRRYARSGRAVEIMQVNLPTIGRVDRPVDAAVRIGHPVIGLAQS